MAGTFRARMDELQAKIGPGTLTMRVNVHQPYAAAEHNRQYYKHPRGGIPDYLETPFMAKHEEMIKILAEGALDDLDAAAIVAVAKFEEWVQTNAPVMLDVLRNSCNLYVEKNGGTIFEKPQLAPYESWKE